MKNKFLYSLICLFVFLLFFNTVQAQQQNYIIRSLLDISSTIRSEFYKQVPEETIYNGAIKEIKQKYSLDVPSVKDQRQFVSVMSSFFQKYPSDSGKIGELAVKGMIKSLNDQYSLFFDTQQWEYFKKVSSGSEFTGIGVELAKKNGNFIIVSPVYGSSAQKAGLRSGDVIVGVAGKNVKGMDDLDVLNLFDGYANTFLDLQIVRNGQVKNFKVQRTPLSMKPPKGSILKAGDQVGYVRIFYFSDKTDLEVKKYLENMKNRGIKKLIIDLRDNPGGDFKASVRLASMFLGRQTVVTRTRNGGVSEKVVGDSDKIFDFKTVILVNRGSASASEVFSGAMQDYKIATLIGEQSFGKALIQSVYGLQGNAGCKITTAKYYPPSGRDILYKGLTPSFKVSNPEPTEKVADDSCINTALNYLKK